MNYLAHAYLSFNNTGWLAGNMISDFVKGKKKEDYPVGIRQGIELHRAIDQFTDEHPATKKAKEVFRPAYRLYCGAFVDIVYDHFLAKDKNRFTPESLEAFAQWVYTSMENQPVALPERFARMLPYMKKQDWLYNYQFDTGMERSFEGLSRRALYIKETNTAYSLFQEQYAVLEECYDSFIPDIEIYAKMVSSRFS